MNTGLNSLFLKHCQTLNLTIMDAKSLFFLLLLCLSCTQPNRVAGDGEAEPANMEAEVVNDDPATNKERVDYAVYVTKEGDKYHTADCRYAKTAHLVKLTQAKSDGKTACGICKPSSTTGEKQVQCSGTTTDGKQCQRMTADASGKCFQHRDS